jgi:uncharacterized protein (DUF1330 family)
MLNDTEMQDLIDFYEPGHGDDALARWRRLFDPAVTSPVTLVNRFTLRPRASYADGRDASGLEALMTYAATSTTSLAKVGGRFLVSSPVVTSLFGPRDATDLVVVGWYPDRAALLAMLRDPDYRAAFEHRRAAVAAEQVLVADAS